MSRHIKRVNIDELIKRNISDLKNDPKLIEQIEKKIEFKHLQELSKAVVAEQ